MEDQDIENTEAEFEEQLQDLADDLEEFEEPADQRPQVHMSTLPITGEPRVDDALARLSDLTNLPVHEHVAVFEDVQRRLHETLADVSGQ